jgi:hypothetical protein
VGTDNVGFCQGRSLFSSFINLHEFKTHKSYTVELVDHLKINPLNAELNPICHLLALLGGATIVVVSRIRVKIILNNILTRQEMYVKRNIESRSCIHCHGGKAIKCYVFSVCVCSLSFLECKVHAH